MATVVTTVTKTASVVKTTKGSEKKWSEILNQNRRHDLQLPLELAKYDHESKRSFRLYERQKDRAERNRANRHETWYQDDFIFRSHLLQQLRPITKRFRHVNSLPILEQNPSESILNDDEIVLVSFEKTKNNKLPVDLPPMQRTKKPTEVGYIGARAGEASKIVNPVFSKLICPKVSNEVTPRLNSHQHAQFLNIAHRFLQRQPEMIEKGVNCNGQQRQNTRVKALIESERERIRLAALTFEQQLQEDKEQDTISETDSYY